MDATTLLTVKYDTTRYNLFYERSKTHGQTTSLRWIYISRNRCLVSKCLKTQQCFWVYKDQMFRSNSPLRCTDNRLRSSSSGNFLVRRTRTRFTDSSFTVAGPAAWNSLPAHIRMIDSHSAFCRHLKPICSLFLTD